MLKNMDRTRWLILGAVLLGAFMTFKPAMSKSECYAKHGRKTMDVRHYCAEQSSWGWKW